MLLSKIKNKTPEEQEAFSNLEKLAKGVEIIRATRSKKGLVVVCDRVILPKNQDAINVFDCRGKIIGKARFLKGTVKLDCSVRIYPAGKPQDYHDPQPINFMVASGEFEVTLCKGKGVSNIFCVGARGTIGYGTNVAIDQKKQN